jgi:hypothetical protein
MFSALMQWLLRLFKHVIVLLSTTCSWWYIYIFLTQLLNTSRPMILFSDFVHAECITQHCVHVATLFCTFTCRICGWMVQSDGCIRIVRRRLTVMSPVYVASHHSPTRCQVFKYIIGRVKAIIPTNLTRASNFTIGRSTVTNYKFHKLSTPIILFPSTSRLCNPSHVHICSIRTCHK